MSIHIAAKAGEIAKDILLPGDPYRAKYVADNFLEDPICYNEVRGMYGFTGTYKGKRISVQGTGMGIPSISIYATELIREYGCQNLIRIGTCGAYNEDTNVRDVILAQGACTNSGVNEKIFPGIFAPIADFGLLNKAYNQATFSNLKVKVGNILSSDTFYDEDPNVWKLWQKFGVLGVEMEAAGLYTIAAKARVNALAILTVSDHLAKKEELTSQEREQSLKEMITLALDTLSQ